MATLDKLLAPYTAAASGTPTTLTELQQDPLWATLFPQGTPGVNRAARDATKAPGGDGLLELFYGGNNFNPSASVDPSHLDHLHVAARHKLLMKLAPYLENMGFDVGGLEGFEGQGPITSGHVPNSYHYKGEAADVNYYGGGQWNKERGALNWLEHWLANNY